ncbi:wsc domain containing protein [Moniliophthora roreri]|nr:wsc domain containing protein [Moniliophthora roreri]
MTSVDATKPPTCKLGFWKTVGWITPTYPMIVEVWRDWLVVAETKAQLYAVERHATLRCPSFTEPPCRSTTSTKQAVHFNEDLSERTISTFIIRRFELVIGPLKLDRVLSTKGRVTIEHSFGTIHHKVDGRTFHEGLFGSVSCVPLFNVQHSFQGWRGTTSPLSRVNVLKDRAIRAIPRTTKLEQANP